MSPPRSRVAFASIVGQQPMKRALLLNAVDPSIGGVLIRGQRGTAKSTAVRALAGVLPDIRVVVGCRFGCDPADSTSLCDECVARRGRGEALEAATRPMRVVELPLNASEDRVVGSIDIESAIRHGERRFDTGVLAAANRNILYADEVNLLDDHVVDVLLDAAAMGRNIVEREGVSMSHPSRFILVGTMNPDEGELRPQLLDRFGLCVDVEGLRTVEERVAVLDADAAREVVAGTDPGGDAHLRELVAAARELLAKTVVPRPIRVLIATLCASSGAVGHRADVVVARTAKAICAMRHARNGAQALMEVDVDDVAQACELALTHRRRGMARSDGEPSLADEARRQYEQIDRDAAERSAAAAVEEQGGGQSTDGTASDAGDAERNGAAGIGAGPACEREHADADAAAGLFSVRTIALPRDRRRRTQPGKRTSSRSGDRRGRYVAATQAAKTTDLAFDATLRAAAPHQARRRAEDVDSQDALRVEPQDLRQKVRRKRTGTLIVFVVDASASMDAEQRMEATKGAVFSLLRDAYVRRDRVALVIFSGRSARVVLQPTGSIDLAEARLARLGIGGTTPLTHGLLAGLKLIRSERLRDPSVRPLMVIISDGRGNISLFGGEPLAEAQRAAEQIGSEQISALVIDSARDHSPAQRLAIPGGAGIVVGGATFNACLDLARRCNGEYLGLYDLSQSAIVAGVHRSIRLGRAR